MALYLLTRNGKCDYDEYHEKVIRAGTESEARRIANDNVGDEGKIWDSLAVDAEIVDPFGKPGEILGDFHAG